jgi:hypothetical protein
MRLFAVQRDDLCRDFRFDSIQSEMMRDMIINGTAIIRWETGRDLHMRKIGWLIAPSS